MSATGERPWRWDRGTQGWGSLANRTVAETSLGRFELKALAPDGQDERFGIVHLDLDGAVKWETELDRPFVSAGVLVFVGNHLYATHHSAISTGARVSKVDAKTGAVTWTTDLRGLGPIGHSKYRNETQLEVGDDGVIVYGNESQGQYIEVVDPRTGRSLSLVRPDPRFTTLEWEGKAAGDPFEFAKGPSALVAGPTRYVVTTAENTEGSAVLQRIDDGRTVWSTALRSEGSCGNAAMRRRGDRLWVAYYCAMSSGTQLLVVDVASGAIEREVPVIGLGPIGHSEYFNEVELSELHDHVVILGREAAGRYIEVVDPRTFRTRAVLTFRD